MDVPVPVPPALQEKTVWDVLLRMYANLLAKLNTTLVGPHRELLGKAPSLSGALVVAEWIHKFGTPVRAQICAIVDAGKTDKWAEVRRLSDEVLDAAVPGPWRAMVDTAPYHDEFLYLMARYAIGFMLAIDDINATATPSSGSEPQPH